MTDSLRRKKKAHERGATPSSTSQQVEVEQTMKKKTKKMKTMHHSQPCLRLLRTHTPSFALDLARATSE